MNRKRQHRAFMPDEGMAAINIHRPVQWFPSDSLANPRQGISRTGRILIWSGFAMAQPDHPRGWQWNPATIVSVLTFLLVIAGLIAGAAWFMGALYTQQMQILNRLDTLEQNTKVAVDRATYAAGLKDKEGEHPGVNKKQEGK